MTGDESVETLYEYTYPMDQYDGPPGSAGSTFSSHGTIDLQRDNTSLLFFYDGPEGLSLVIVHGRFDGEQDQGGTVSFTVTGLPSDGQWIVRDDYYLTDDGEPESSNFDRWDVDGETHTIDWAYRSGRTDGGAFRGLQPEFELRLNPAFNEAAALAADHEFGPIESWEVLSGDIANPERYPLRLDQPVRIRTGECPPADDKAGADSNIDAQIHGVWIGSRTVETGDEVRSLVSIENTGDQVHTFFVGFNVIDSNGTPHNNGGSTGKPITLMPGETTTVTVEWTVERDVPRGPYGIKVIVWQESSRDNLQTQLDNRQIESAFKVD